MRKSTKRKKKYLPIPVHVGGKTYYAHGPLVSTTIDKAGRIRRTESWPKEFTK